MTTDTIIKRPGWWSRRSHLEKTLLLFTLLAALVIAGLSIALIGLMSNSLYDEALPTVTAALEGNNSVTTNDIPRNEKKEDICLTEGCIHTASFILKSLDQKIDPCEDFYSYACGGYIANSHIPDDKSSTTSDQLTKQLRVVLEEKEEPNQPHHVKLAKQLYKACMNTSLIEKRGLTPLLDMLKKLGGWPVLEGDKWDMGSFDWRETVYKFRKNGHSVDYIIDFSVSTDTKNSKQRIISLDQASLGLNREYLIKGLDDPFVSGYRSYMVDIAVLMGADRHRAEKELAQVLDFEMKLANISLPAEERRNGTKLYNPMTVDELQSNYSTIPWMTYLNSILPPESKVNHTEVIIVTVPEYLRKLEPLLSQTEKRVLANYLLWRAAAVTVPYLTEDVRKRQLQFGTVLSGKTEREPRWHECVDIVASGVSLSVGSLYVTRYFDNAAKQSALEIVSDIRAQMVQTLNELDWMDEITRKKGIEKAKSMAVHIGYPDELVDSDKLSNFYKDLHIDPENYMESVLNLTKFGTNFSFRRLRQPVNKTEWITHGRPAIVNAFYSSIENSIQFPAGILQGVFFDNSRPRFMNYGAIGFVIGHEITHGFDDQGRQFDTEGNLVDWWEPKTKTQYLDKARCIIHQYGNYTEPLTGLHLNGINTQGENIADNGGIRLAYNAYHKWLSRQNEPEASLPGLPGITPQKAFWISAAQAWCSKYRKESMRNRVTTGVHSPGQFRVLGPLSNAPEFARDYSCQLGTPMNPTHKCRVF